MKRLGLIGGTGLDHWGNDFQTYPISSAYGAPSAALAGYRLGGLQLFFLPRHGGQHEIPPHAVNYRANIDAFRQMEVDGILAVNAVGAISPDYHPGVLVVPDQLIDYTWGREHTFHMTSADALAHIEFANPFEGRVRSLLLKSAGLAGIDVIDGGCLAVSQGPRLETAAEIHRFKQDGCDLVGMTSMPEAALAREAGLDYASLCVSANRAAGLDDKPVTMEAIERTLMKSMVEVRKLLEVFFGEFTNVH